MAILKKSGEIEQWDAQEEQERIEQEVFCGLNSTDTILNLIREGLQSMTEVSVRQDGLCMAMEGITESVERLRELASENCQKEFAGILDTLAQIAGLLVSGGEDMIRAVSVFQAALEETENSNRILHTIEEQMVEYFEKEEEQYEHLTKGSEGE